MNPADQFITRGSVFAAGWCSMTDREDARRAALLRLLEDWEAGRMP